MAGDHRRQRLIRGFEQPGVFIEKFPGDRLNAKRLLDLRQRRFRRGVLQQRQKAGLRGMTFLLHAHPIGIAPRRRQSFLGLDLAGLGIALRFVLHADV